MQNIIKGLHSKQWIIKYLLLEVISVLTTTVTSLINCYMVGESDECSVFNLGQDTSQCMTLRDPGSHAL